jgi:hypothetical protein
MFMASENQLTVITNCPWLPSAVSFPPLIGCPAILAKLDFNVYTFWPVALSVWMLSIGKDTKILFGLVVTDVAVSLLHVYTAMLSLLREVLSR